MKLDADTIAGLAEHLETCQLQVHDTLKITDEHPQMDWDDAYAIQAELLRRKRSRGLRLAGLKCGLTSHAKMKQMSAVAASPGLMIGMIIERSWRGTPAPSTCAASMISAGTSSRNERSIQTAMGRFSDV